jgi:putative pyruvate formate lyase activating enzyme
VKVARAALHMWEEPCISGEEGSGAVFFSGCNLRCVFCQNACIADGGTGVEISVDRLSRIFLELQRKGANNINLVTPSHYVEQVAEALRIAKIDGLSIPVLYNTGSYELVETLKMLDGLVDIYLPDMKYFDSALSEKYSHAKDYFKVASKAISEMYRQVGECAFDERGMMRRGIIARHLILPGHTADSKKVIQYLYGTYGDSVYISIMNQYTPLPHVAAYPEINRKVTKREYDSVVDFAIDLGVTNAFIQEGGVASASFIPQFDGEGVK